MKKEKIEANSRKEKSKPFTPIFVIDVNNNCYGTSGRNDNT